MGRVRRSTLLSYGKDAEEGLSLAVVFPIRISRCREVADGAYFGGVLFQ
jgi:hypothetical protein